jgi:hypothetical protein
MRKPGILWYDVIRIHTVCSLVIQWTVEDISRCCYPLIQVKENPAALLALCWYWASEGIGNKVSIVDYFCLSFFVIVLCIIFMF